MQVKCRMIDCATETCSHYKEHEFNPKGSCNEICKNSNSEKSICSPISILDKMKERVLTTKKVYDKIK